MFIIIDVMENEIYYCNDEIELGFKLDSVTAYRDRIEIPYKVRHYNFGKVISIRSA